MRTHYDDEAAIYLGADQRAYWQHQRNIAASRALAMIDLRVAEADRKAGVLARNERAR